MRKVAISSGHGKYVRGARGSPVPPELDERDENVRVVDRVFTLLGSAGAGKFHDDTSRSQSENLNRIVSWHNSQTRDLDVSVHFNAGGNDNLMGTEVLYVTQNVLAAEVSSAVADAADWPNRGAKKRTDLAFLNGTNKPAILIETCFCDSRADSARYQERFEAICTQIAAHISDQVAPGPEPEPEPEPEPGEVAEVNITTKGDVKITVDGQEVAPIGPSIPTNQKNVTATVFGGASDPNNSAYDGQPLNDRDFYVALPWKFPGTRPRVRVHGPNGSAEAEIMDVGPWCTTNNYWDLAGDPRPLAETCHSSGTPLPPDSGPNAGKVPSNDAGIDLSPALADAVGIQGKGKVDWEFV
jgi:N-acetylmuramoyl-L-alanine amidase